MLAILASLLPRAGASTIAAQIQSVCAIPVLALGRAASPILDSARTRLVALDAIAAAVAAVDDRSRTIVDLPGLDASEALRQIKDVPAFRRAILWLPTRPDEESISATVRVADHAEKLGVELDRIDLVATMVDRNVPDDLVSARLGPAARWWRRRARSVRNDGHQLAMSLGAIYGRFPHDGETLGAFRAALRSGQARPDDPAVRRRALAIMAETITRDANALASCLLEGR